MPTRTAAAIMNRIDREGAVTIRGLNALALARDVLDHAVRAAGYKITFDPGSSVDLVDGLTVTAASSVESATIGAGLGAFIGLFFGCPAQGAALGARIGLMAGAARGLDRVHQGWRVRAVREIDGTAYVTISALGPAPACR
jgi:hypothetical protein